MKKGRKKSKYVMDGLHREPVPDREMPEMDEAWFRQARRGVDGLAEIIGEQAAKPMRGRPRAADPKENGTLRLPAGLWKRIKASGRGYSLRVEKVLMEAVEAGRI